MSYCDKVYTVDSTVVVRVWMLYKRQACIFANLSGVRRGGTYSIRQMSART